MRSAWFALAVVGCKMDAQPQREPAPIPAVVASVPADAAPAPDAPPPDAPPPDAAPMTDEAFRDAVRAFASRPGQTRDIGAWGTVRLDGSRKRYRFATLLVPTTSDWRPVDGSAGTGLYIVEQAPDLYWPLACWWTDGGYGVDPEANGGEPPWIAHDDNAMEHAAMHNHGKSHETFALRGGRFVVLYEDDYNSRRDPDDVEHAWADASGKCKHTCPPLARHDAAGHPVVLWWPAHSIAELTEPSLDMLNTGDWSHAPGPDVVRP